jgi:hypothetical protein
MGAMPVTYADFLLHGRVENYRARLTDLLVELDKLVREQMEALNVEKLEGKGRVVYTIKPPEWTLAWRAKGGEYEANLMAFAQGGAWVIHGRMGLNRPYRNVKSLREKDAALIRQETLDQIDTDIRLL